MNKLLIKIILSFSFFIIGTNIVFAEDTEIAKLFKAREVLGTILISSLDGETEYIHNVKRAQQALLPASTFKVPNTLISLDEGAIENEKQIIKWDGKDKGWNAWNKDQTLESAFRLTCVWCFQELASRVGNKNYLVHLKKLNYGNQKTGSNIRSFWLDGDLKISAFGQIRFLKKLYKGVLPYKKDHMNILKKIMVVEETPNYIIRAKIGWAMRIVPQHGWYIGWVEKNNTVWFFATNIKIKEKRDSQYRKEITMEALKLKRII